MSEIELNTSDECVESDPLYIKEEAESSGHESSEHECSEHECSEHDSIPSKSEKMYQAAYDAFVTWKHGHQTTLTSENILLAYFNDLSKKYKPSTLWSIYSMLKKTLKIKERINIDHYHAFKLFMKKQSSGFKSTKSNVLKSEEIEKFLAEAPDHKYLATKTALIFGISGACRSNELVNLRSEDITQQGNLLVVDLSIARTKKPRTFVITEEFTKIVQKYMEARPKISTNDRFFMRYEKGKCTPQVIGIHRFSRMPREIAAYLKLENPDSYTGHAFRRTSATLRADSRTTITTLKRPCPPLSSGVVESSVEKSVINMAQIGNIITSAVNRGCAEISNRNADVALPKVRRIETFKEFTFEKNISDEQSSSNGGETPPTNNESIIFNNCSFVINYK